jgi:hypothetical protein
MAAMYFTIVQHMTKQLGRLEKWLEMASAHAQAKSFDPNNFVGQRLAPDQFPLSRQVQSACDTCKLAAARLAGKEAPSHPDTEKTIDELRARVRTVVAYLNTLTAADFEGAGTRVITNPRWEGKVMSGEDYFLEHSIPNFYFHVNHAYAILRHNGVHLGKRDYLGPLTMKTP